MCINIAYALYENLRDRCVSTTRTWPVLSRIFNPEDPNLRYYVRYYILY